jgi:hypothetical protein
MVVDVSRYWMRKIDSNWGANLLEKTGYKPVQAGQLMNKPSISLAPTLP